MEDGMEDFWYGMEYFRYGMELYGRWKICIPFHSMPWILYRAYATGHQHFLKQELLFGTDSCEGLPVWYTHF